MNKKELISQIKQVEEANRDRAYRESVELGAQRFFHYGEDRYFETSDKLKRIFGE